MSASHDTHPVTETPHSAHSLIPCFVAGKFALAVDPEPHQGINECAAMSRHVISQATTVQLYVVNLKKISIDLLVSEN